MRKISHKWARRGIGLALGSVLSIGGCASTSHGENVAPDTFETDSADQKILRIRQNLGEYYGEYLIRAYNPTADSMMIGVEWSNPNDGSEAQGASSEISIGETVEILGLKVELIDLEHAEEQQNKPGAGNVVAVVGVSKP